jgi:hypothetical protein
MAEVDSASDDRTANNAVRHQYRVLNENEKHAMLRIKDSGAAFLSVLDDLESGELPLSTTAKIGREFALARTKVQEAVMWAVNGITK